nr:small heat shock protein [Protodriloides chaetifer]
MAATVSSVPLRDRSNVMSDYKTVLSEPQYFDFQSTEKLLNKAIGIPINIERSPRDSPDIFKKKPRTQTPLSPSDRVKAIIKETARAVQEVCPPLSAAAKKTILKPSRCESPARTERRKVQFNHNVAVCLIDAHGDRVCMTNENLNTYEGGSDNPMYTRLKRSKSFTPLTYSQKPTTNDSTVVKGQGHTTESLRSSPHVDPPIPTGIIHQSSVSNESKINISFASDRVSGTKLKFVLYIGPQYNANDVVVKACTNGSKLRVVASTTVHKDGVTSLSQFNERFTMPMEVDPFAVDAKMDNRGYLTVEAPLMTTERRERVRRRLPRGTDV